MRGAILSAVVTIFTLIMFAVSSDAWSRGRTVQSSDLAEANRLTNNAIKLYDAGKYDQALPLLIQALAIAEKSAGMDNPVVAVILDNLATVYLAKKEYSQAESALQRSLRIREKAFGPNALETSQSSFNLGDLYQISGNFAQATSFYERAFTIRERLLKPGDVNTVIAAFRYSCVLRKTNHPKDAEAVEARSQMNRDKEFPKAAPGSTVPNGGIRVGKLLSAPRPVYPSVVTQWHASNVRVNILIDEKGTVISACAASGDQVLWPYAEGAAYRALYSPTTLMGIPIRAPGVLAFDFKK
jgi:tetratricopeptide (TPR) repeat protein